MYCFAHPIRLRFDAKRAGKCDRRQLAVHEQCRVTVANWRTIDDNGVPTATSIHSKLAGSRRVLSRSCLICGPMTRSKTTMMRSGFVACTPRIARSNTGAMRMEGEMGREIFFAIAVLGWEGTMIKGPPQWHCRPPGFARRNILPHAGGPLMASRACFGLETQPKNVIFPAGGPALRVILLRSPGHAAVPHHLPTEGAPMAAAPSLPIRPHPCSIRGPSFSSCFGGWPGLEAKPKEDGKWGGSRQKKSVFAGRDRSNRIFRSVLWPCVNDGTPTGLRCRGTPPSPPSPVPAWFSTRRIAHASMISASSRKA